MLHQSRFLAARDIYWQNFVRNIFLLDIPVSDMQIMKMVRLLRTGATCQRTVATALRKARKGMDRQRLCTFYIARRSTLTAPSPRVMIMTICKHHVGKPRSTNARSFDKFPQQISRITNRSCELWTSKDFLACPNKLPYSSSLSRARFGFVLDDK